MTQLFHPATNTFSRFTIFGAVFIVGILGWILYAIYRSPYQTQVGVAREQPVQFSHAHHVGQIGIDCRYCHTSVEDSSFAGIPATSVCMGCHSVLYKDSPMLAPVHESFRNKEPLRWTRVHDLPDFTYFNHSIHVAKGVACVTCHGQVNEMPLMWKDQTLHMQWCLECHRNPERYVRDKLTVFNPDLTTPAGQIEGSELVEAYKIITRQLSDCSVCHR